MDQRNYYHGNHGQHLPQQHQNSGSHRPHNHPGWRVREQPQSHHNVDKIQVRHQPQHRKQQELPPGWVEAMDPTNGRVYYCNPLTRETKWERPTVITGGAIVSGDLPSQRPQQHQQQDPLPPGWVDARDPSSGKIYFCNPQTRETRWERPTAISSTPHAMRLESQGSMNEYGNISDTNGRHADSNPGVVVVDPTMTQLELNHQSVSSNKATTTGANNNSDVADFDELTSLTGGQISYMMKLQQLKKNISIEIKEPSKYVPLHISLMSSVSTTERTEPGRLDVRMYALREELKRFG